MHEGAGGCGGGTGVPIRPAVRIESADVRLGHEVFM